MSCTTWLAERNYPKIDCWLALPAAMEFVLRSRADLSWIDPQTKDGRLAMYFWWERRGRWDYPDLEWTLTPDEVKVIDEIERFQLLDEFPVAVTFWFRYCWTSILNLPELKSVTFVNDSHIINTKSKLPIFLMFLMEQRVDLKQNFDIDTINGVLGICEWWLKIGRREYERILWIPKIPSVEEFMSERSGVPGIPAFLMEIFKSRADLSNVFNLNTYIGRHHLKMWWERQGRNDYPALAHLTFCFHYGGNTNVEEILNEQSEFPGIPAVLAELWNERDDLRNSYNLSSYVGRHNFKMWWEQHGKREYPALENINFTITMFEKPSALELINEQSEFEGIPAFLVELRKNRADLLEAFDFSTEAGRSSMIGWWEKHGRLEYSTLSHVGLKIKNGEQNCKFLINRPEAIFHCREKGVNVVGYPRGALGIGEDARLGGLCLEAAAQDYVMVESTHTGPEKLVELPDSQFSCYLKYDTTVFYLPPIEMLRLALEGGKALVNDLSYKIGAWPWELPKWPSTLGGIYQFVDEIWAQSRFVETTYSKCSTVPVNYVPMAVDIPKPTRCLRRELLLPSQDFLFYILFDGNSHLRRKNPLAAVQAFVKAFPKEEGVGLVIKVMNVKENDQDWQKIKELAYLDDRIHLITSMMSRQDIINFMHSCDAYISLHRSEGFGRVIAESMLLGKPVIVTNFSGNLDFCSEKTSYLVDGDLVPLKPGDYPMWEGQYWCDADINLASHKMQDVLQDKDKRNRVAEEGKRFILKHHSIKSVAQKYKARLNAIRLAGA